MVTRNKSCLRYVRRASALSQGQRWCIHDVLWFCRPARESKHWLWGGTLYVCHVFSSKCGCVSRRVFSWLKSAAALLSQKSPHPTHLNFKILDFQSFGSVAVDILQLQVLTIWQCIKGTSKTTNKEKSCVWFGVKWLNDWFNVTIHVEMCMLHWLNNVEYTNKTSAKVGAIYEL